MLLPVIMSGGSGSRLWPLSRAAFPKPYVPLPDGTTLIGKTYERARNLRGVTDLMVVTNRDFLFLSADCIEDLGEPHPNLSYILEPMARNTAAATAMATLAAIKARGPDTVVLLLPADHLIRDTNAFAQAVEQARLLATENKIVTFGIHPEYPETGYGYIQTDDDIVLRFVEKPDYHTAQTYIESGNYVWNSGMFCFRAQTMIEAMQTLCPDILESVARCINTAKTRRERGAYVTECEASDFHAVRSEAIDTAVMEKATNIACVRVDCGWSDVGSWDAMATMFDESAPTIFSTGDVISHASKNVIVRADKRLVSLVGVQDLIVVDTPDALLVANRDKSQDIKDLFGHLQRDGHPTATQHTTVYRPWGTATLLENGPGFRVKRIILKPHSSLSLQQHAHRSEHWVVVEGIAHVETDDGVITIAKGESTFIRPALKHRLINPGDTDLIIIETQSGDIISEDDIVRHAPPELPQKTRQ